MRCNLYSSVLALGGLLLLTNACGGGNKKSVSRDLTADPSADAGESSAFDGGRSLAETDDGGSAPTADEPDGSAPPSGPEPTCSDCATDCAVLACDLEGRLCVEGNATTQAHCGGCERGYAEDSFGQCVQQTCREGAPGSLLEQCEGLRRECVGDDGEARCGECVSGTSAESPTDACRGQCRGDECECPDGAGYHPFEEGCFSCSGGALACDAPGETGNVLAVQAEDGATCICETESGYYTGAEGRQTFACDADGDGWLVDSAQAALEGVEPVIRENARCERRTIRRFVLRSELGNSFEVPGLDLFEVFPGDVTRGIAAGLPLYESDRNDGQPSAEPLDGFESGRSFEPAELNSLTRACVTPNGDFNHNGVADVGEWAESTVGDPVPDSAGLRQYYARYTEFAYWVELHEGWFSAAGETTDARYTIAERPRRGVGPEVVGLAYPEGSSEYVTRCERGIDELYSGSPPNGIGGDFAHFGDSAGMFHHSQFKCVEIASDSAYRQAGYNRQSHPQMMAQSGFWRLPDGREEGLDWSLNDCAVPLDGEGSRPSADSKNPTSPPIACDTAGSFERGTVRWATVDYVPYDTPYSSNESRGDYVRGCFGACVQEQIIVGSCDTCGAEGDGSGAAYPTPAGDRCRGELGVCNGAGVCGVCVPGALRCSGNTLQTCGANGQWTGSSACTYCVELPGPNEEAECRECVPGARDCVGSTPRLCTAEGRWQAQSACAGDHSCQAGICLGQDGAECSVGADCISGQCNAYYLDNDSDGYGGAETLRCGPFVPPGTVSNNSDCCDSDSDAHPGQSRYFTRTRSGCGGYDFNCNGASSRESTRQAVCTLPYNPVTGWLNTVPSCGQSGEWVTHWGNSGGYCYIPSRSLRTMACR